MIKKKFFSFLFMNLLASSFLFSQERTGIVQYSVSRKQDDIYISNDVLNKSFKKLDNLEYELKFDNTQSIYSLKDLLSLQNDEVYVRMATSIAGRGIYYTNLRDKKRIRHLDFRGDKFLISYPFEKPSWNITNEIKKIKGYSCRKATLVLEKSIMRTKPVNVIAWFTHQIPYGYGPKLFFGLPGLIMELEEGGLLFTASDIELGQNIQIEPPSTGIKISEFEYNDYIIKKSKEMGFIKN